MSEREKDVAFLRVCLLYDDSPERHKLEEGIRELQRKQRCVGRAVRLMGLLLALAVAGICYTAVDATDSLETITQFMARFMSKIFCALALGSLMCLLAFLGLGAVYRKHLDAWREDCRRAARELLKLRLGKPPNLPLPALTPLHDLDQAIVLRQGTDDRAYQ